MGTTVQVRAVVLLFALVLLLTSLPVEATRACKRIVQVQHRGLRGVVQVPLSIWEPCEPARRRFLTSNPGGLPAVLVANGGLIVARNYDQLGARAGAARNGSADITVRRPCASVANDGEGDCGVA